MPADLTREEIEWMRDDFALASDLEPGDIYRLFSHIKGEPARIASARQEGYREGVADAKHAAGFAAWRHEGDDARSRGMDAGARHQVAECVKAIVALSPLPAEPSDGWIEWEGGECPAPGCVVEIRQRRHEALRRFAEVIGRGRSENYRWTHRGGPNDIIAYRIVKPAEPSTTRLGHTDLMVSPEAIEEVLAAEPSAEPRHGWFHVDGDDRVTWSLERPADEDAPAPDLIWPATLVAMHSEFMAACEALAEKRAEVDRQDDEIAALEAENAALKARNAELVEGLRPLAKIGGEIDRYAPQLHDEDGTSVAIGDLRRARALLQGGPDAG